MVEFFTLGGAVVILELLCMLLALGYTVSSIIKVKELEHDIRISGLETGINAILFLSGINVLIGLIGAVIKIMKCAYTVYTTNSFTAQYFWTGIQQVFIMMVFGLFFFICGTILWFILHYQYKKYSR